MVYPNLGIAGPWNSTEKNPLCGKKLSDKQLFVQQAHTVQYININSVPVKRLTHG